MKIEVCAEPTKDSPFGIAGMPWRSRNECEQEPTIPVPNTGCSLLGLWSR